MDVYKNIFIGTSGWYYKGWLGNFYPEKMPAKNLLPFYSSIFNSVELNTSFYGMPTLNSILKWCNETPKI